MAAQDPPTFLSSGKPPLHAAQGIQPRSRSPSRWFLASDALALALPHSQRMTTILIADDEPPIVELVRFTLEDEHVQVVTAFDGVTALDVALAIRPDLVLLDVQMPGLSGLEVCRRLRRATEGTPTRVVMLTAAGQEEDRARGLAAGADEYLTKPFSPLVLLALVRSLIPEVPVWPAE
jgi:CheY-like chemotaxis protein